LIFGSWILIVTDQKVIVGALNVVVEMVVECVKNASWNGGGCVPAGAPTKTSNREKHR